MYSTLYFHHQIGHKSVWAQTCVGTHVSGHKRVWTQTCLGTNMCVHKRVWAQPYGPSRVGPIMYEHKRGGTVPSGTYFASAKQPPNHHLIYLFFFYYYS